MITVTKGNTYTFINHDTKIDVEKMDAWQYPCGHAWLYTCGHLHNRAMGFPNRWVCKLGVPCADGTKIKE